MLVGGALSWWMADCGRKWKMVDAPTLVAKQSTKLDELVAYYDGQITENEWLNLQWNLKLAANRPDFTSAYDFLKDGYPKKVRDYWESLGEPQGLRERVDNAVGLATKS